MQAWLGIQGGPIFSDAAANDGAKMERGPVGRCVALRDDVRTLRNRLLPAEENGLEIEFQEQFTWKPALVEVSVDFWADEAVEGYWLHNVVPCPCRD
jgi:hypothetical protein